MKANTLNTLKKSGMLAIVVFGLGLGGCASVAPPGYGDNRQADDNIEVIEEFGDNGNLERRRTKAQGNASKQITVRETRRTSGSQTYSGSNASRDGAAAGKAAACAKEEYKNTPMCTGG